jgi:hypothetical protein
MALARNITDSGTFSFEGFGSSLLKIFSALAVGGGATTLVIGGMGAATTAAGVGGAGVAAYAAADAIADNDEMLIPHTSPTSSELIEDYFGEVGCAAGGNREGTAASDISPEIAQALGNYHEMKDIMKGLGIRLEDDAEFTPPIPMAAQHRAWRALLLSAPDTRD